MDLQRLRLARNKRAGCSCIGLGRSLRVETLEPRILLDADGFITGTDVHLTLSFAADDTLIAGQANALAATFDALPSTPNWANWEEAILAAFQTWAVETNADIGVVSDSNDPFGTAGLIQKDDRFGDIRIGAIEMSPGVGAVSVPVGGLVSGTWFGDVVFNTAYSYNSLDDLYAVALHEAGNVFGLEDNTDPNSPLFDDSVLPPTGLPPTANDLAALQLLHGIRTPDANESDDGITDNDSFANATEWKAVEVEGFEKGSAPSIVYGDITDNLDSDFFELKIPDEYSGSVTIQVRTESISLLAPKVTIYDDSITPQLLLQTESTSTSGDILTFQIPNVGPDDSFFLEIRGANPGLFGIGGYSLVAIFDGINQVDQATIDSIAGGQFRFLEQEDINKFFDADEDEHFGDDDHTDDSPIEAGSLQTAVGFVEATRYEVVGSIADATDIDFYQVKSPQAEAGPLDVMTVLVRSLDTGGLVPQATVYDKNDLLVPSTILANGSGDYILQVDGVTADDNYQVEIKAADSSGPFNTGNYSLAVVFDSHQATQLNPMSVGTVGNGTTQNIHTLYIGQPQLLHLALNVVPASTTTPTAVVVTIYDDTQTIVYQIAATPGELRSREAVLLNPGIYTVEVIPVTLDGSLAPALSYELLGIAISDLFVGDPDDPNSHPFECTEPGLEGFFCYPGDIVSEDPFLWDDFIDSLNTTPNEPDLTTLVTQIFGDWWSWVWNQSGLNGPPFGMPDSIQVQETSASATLAALVGPNGSVLDNDIDPEGDPLVALLQSGTTHGSLNLATNGTFTYTPDPGFQGRDTFTYTAFDFTQESAAAMVTIIVGESGDFDVDGDVDGSDFLTWQRSVGTTPDAILTDGDSDFDGDVDSQDLNTWQLQFNQPSTLVTSNGDFDADGDFDGSDFLAWQRGFGTTVGASSAGGDADADGVVNGQDLAIWQGNFGTGAATVVMASVSEETTNPVPVASLSATSLMAPLSLLSQSETSDPQPVFATEQTYVAPPPASKTLTPVSQPRRQFEAHDRVFTSFGLSRTQDFRYGLADYFAELNVMTKIG